MSSNIGFMIHRVMMNEHDGGVAAIGDDSAVVTKGGDKDGIPLFL
jgi:hypothetical protein